MNIQLAQETLRQQLIDYIPFDEKESLEKIRFINFLEKNTDVYSRENLTGHITASSWIVNKNRDKVLLIYHNIYKSRCPL